MLATAGYYHNLALTDQGRVFQWGKLYTEKEGSDANTYFGISINLPGLDAELIAASHRRYYAAGLSASELEEGHKVPAHMPLTICCALFPPPQQQQHHLTRARS